jgi:hypothetical protein
MTYFDSFASNYVRYTWLYSLTAAQVWAAWKNQKITAGELADWQQRHGIYFDQEGNVK